jgi:hypothetical protein
LAGVDHQLATITPHTDVSIVKRPTRFGVVWIIDFRRVLCTHPERKTAATRYGFSRQAISRSGLVRSVVQM